MRETMVLFYKRIAERLGPRGAVAEFVRKTGIMRSQVDGWKDGIGAPGLDKLDIIAEGLGYSSSWELLVPLREFSHEVSIEVFEQKEHPNPGHETDKSEKRGRVGIGAQKPDAAHHEGDHAAHLDNGPGKAGSFGHTPSSEPSLSDLMAEIRALRAQMKAREPAEPKSLLFGDVVAGLRDLSDDELKAVLHFIATVVEGRDPAPSARKKLVQK